MLTILPSLLPCRHVSNFPDRDLLDHRSPEDIVMATVGLLYHRFGVAEACANPHVSNTLTMANMVLDSEVLA